MTTLEDIEVEFKFPLNNSQDLSQRLEVIAELRERDVFHRDTYYTPQHRNFLDQDPILEWLRVRETKGNSSLNYKRFTPKNSTSCYEVETSVDAVTMKKILGALDFREIVTVEKLRNTWFYKGILVSIDRVKELGYFLELEACKEFASVDEAEERIQAVLGGLGADVGELDFRGYPYLLLKEKKRI